MPPIPLLHILSDMDPGGAQFCILDFVGHLDRDRFAPQVCCLREEGELAERLRAMDVPVHLCRFESRFSPFGLLALRKLLRRESIGIVHTHLRRANAAGRLGAVLAGTPVRIAHHHDTILEQKAYQRWMTRWLAKRSQAILCVSQTVKATRVAAGLETPDQLTVFHNFIDPTTYQSSASPKEARAELGLPAEATVIGIVGRLHPFKNHMLFLDAVNQLRDDETLHFAIIGDGMLRDDLTAKVQDLGLTDRVTFTGQRMDMPRVYQALDLVALTSTQEGFPKILLESQAAGVPVVATPVGGVDELLSGGGGLVIEAPSPRKVSPEAVANTIRAALDKATRNRLQSECTANVQRFTPAQQMTILQNLYARLWEESQRKP